MEPNLKRLGKELGKSWVKIGTKLENNWKNLRINFEDLWIIFGKIYLNCDG